MFPSMIVCGGTSTLRGDVVFSMAWQLSYWVSSTPGWGPTGGVPCRLAHHGVERLSFGFEMGLLSIAYLEPEIVMGVFTIQGTPCASREKSHSRSPRVTERVSA